MTTDESSGDEVDAKFAKVAAEKKRREEEIKAAAREKARKEAEAKAKAEAAKRKLEESDSDDSSDEEEEKRRAEDEERRNGAAASVPDQLVLLAQNEAGYGNLLHLLSKSFLETPPGDLHIEVQQVDHPSRVHLDIETDDIEAEVRRLEGVGARRIADIRRWVVMEAPTGQRFCVVRAGRANFAEQANTWD